ncbi:hypothetical protein EV421DRAFT_1740129 [Armillaria borealis]|uniref:Uncharacterized protein n=1 Tax=Armillaria borealis TaxID=47425 RepID=A0AA39J5H3_9AGAR|nr:hypothetical protein EV421DRAFT_1740129 [Armillaria borealis]
MAHNERTSSNPTREVKWREIATTVVTSTNFGTASNTVALLVILWCLLSSTLPPLRPSSAIDFLEEAIKQVKDIYNTHQSMLDQSATFENGLEKYFGSGDNRASILTSPTRIEFATLSLKEQHIQNSLNVSWMNLLSRLSHEKNVWVTARAHRRNVDALESELVTAIIKKKKDLLRTSLENQGVTNDQGDDQAIRRGIDACVTYVKSRDRPQTLAGIIGLHGQNPEFMSAAATTDICSSASKIFSPEMHAESFYEGAESRTHSANYGTVKKIAGWGLESAEKYGTFSCERGTLDAGREPHTSLEKPWSPAVAEVVHKNDTGMQLAM